MTKPRKMIGMCIAVLIVAMALQLLAISIYATNSDAPIRSSVQQGTVEALEPQYTEDEIVTVVVQLQEEPLLAYSADVYTYDQGLSITAKGEQILQKLESQQEVVIQSIEDEILQDEADVIYRYTLISNAVAMEVPYGDMEAISMLPGVECVYISPELSIDPMMSSAADMQQASTVWEDLGYHGEGMVIAVLDTGIDTDHPFFADAPDGARLTKSDIINLRVGMHGSDATYISEKIPFAYNYADRTTRVDHNGGHDHGTHVAGICAGNQGVLSNVSGIAPEAQLAVFKVLSDSGSGATTDILAAVEDAIRLGVDVINMSLGSPAGFTYYGQKMPAYDEIYGNVEKAGIFLSVAAGNSFSAAYGNKWGYNLSLTSNPDTGIIATPASLLPSTTVASVNNAYESGVGFYLDGVAYSYTDRAQDGEPKMADLEPGIYEYEVIEKLGSAEGYEGKDMAGKIAVVSRGTITFNEKVQNAADAGAVAIIIYNNEPGVINMQVNSRRIPAVSVTQHAGGMLVEAAQDGKGMLELVDGVVQAESEYGYQMSEFSSWGATPDLRLEPDVAAIGGNVFSSLDNGTYGSSSGTSMATPNLAGCATLLLQYMKTQEAYFGGMNRYDTNILANALLMGTARPLKNPNGGYYSPRKQGAGLVQLKDAIDATAYLSVDGMNRPKIELGDDPQKTGLYTLTFDVTNFGDTAITYDLSVAVLTESIFHSEEYGLDFIAEESKDLTTLTNVTYTTGQTVKVKANCTETVSVQLELTTEAKAYLDENFKNGIYVEGYVFLTPTKGSDITLSIPYMGFYGDWTAAPAIDLGTYGDGADSLSSQYENCAFSAVNYWDKGDLMSEYYFSFGFNPYWEMYDSATPDGIPFYAGRGCITNRPEVINDGQQGVFAYTGMYVSLLRNAETLSFIIRNVDTGEVYWESVHEKALKS